MQNINVNIVPDSYPQTIRFSQGDVGREFKINVVGFSIPAGATVKIQATKPSGFGFSVAGTVDGNAVSFTTTAVMTDEAGRFPAELEITKDSVVIGTANFIMWGEANPHPEGTTDGQQGTIIPELTLLVERVEAAASSVLDMEVEATTLPAGSQATYSYDEDLNKVTFGIPQGEAGAGAVGVVASAYSASATYKVGDYVIHNSNLYRCTTAIATAEAFTAAHWTQIVLADDVSDLKSDLDDLAERDLLPFTLSPWESHGTIDSNGQDAYLWATARTKNITSYNKDVVFTCDSGYRFFIAYYNQDDSFDHLSTLGTGDVYVEANQKFRLVMRLLPDGSGEASVLSKHIHIRDTSYLVSNKLEETDKLLSKVSEETQNLFTSDNTLDEIGFTYSNGTIKNSSTDTRNNLQLIIYILDSSNTVLGQSSLKSITSNGLVALKVSASTAGKKIEIKHNGSSLDLKYRFACETEANQEYTFSCYVAGHNPKAVNGIVLNEIQFEKGSIPTEYVPHETAVDSIARTLFKYYTDTKNVLWLGTSIPEGAEYPNRACSANGYKCINKAVGSSKLCFDNEYIAGASDNKGRRLTATIAELEALYRGDVTNGVITESVLNEWKAGSYENSVLPYINGTNEMQVSMIVIDHGFNDSGSIITQLEDVENINWASDDRSTFTGAFRYLMNQIQAINPFIKIVIAGYFTNTIHRLANIGYYGDAICRIQELIGEHYDISVMKAWEHTQINGEFVAGTSSYIADFNTKYGTSYTPMLTDSNGNIPAIQIYCPDTIHPHTDKTGNTNKRLNAVYTKLLAHMI